ncbi:MAG TPA: pantetheine-phosphate adenylyltransferase [Candidatus Fraserbacteria bacterium]|nr:pantetheine-phosphate adenylyltransferase [Candidatus Fraserbacteria bacterium]
MRLAIYPGSFDPITNGHLDIIRRAQRLFDRLIVAVMANPSKHPLFTLEERRRLVERSLQERNIHEVEVIARDCLLIGLARELGAAAIIRGLRITSDFENEFQTALTNRDLDSSIESVYLMTNRDYSFISSSIVKEVKRYGAEVSRFVPQVVERALGEKFQKV